MQQLTMSALIAFLISSSVGAIALYYVNWTIKQNSIKMQNIRKANKIAELYALWYQTLPNHLSYRVLMPDDFKLLNQLQFEISFYLSKELFKELTDALADPAGGQAMPVFAKVRNYVSKSISEEELGIIENTDYAIW